MAKNTPTKTKIVSKKHLARLERERRQTQIITYVSIGIITAVVLLIGYGILNQTVLLARKPVITVNGETANVHEFQVRVRIARQQQINQYRMYQQYSLYGLDVSQQLAEIESQLDDTIGIGQQIITTMEDDLLIQQYAKANGITVSEADVDKSVKDNFGYYPDGTPTPTLTSASDVASTLSAQQYALVTPTPTVTIAPTETLSPTEIAAPTATATVIPSITPTATPYTLDGFTKSYQDALKSYSKLGITEADLRKIFFENKLYRERVTDLVTADVSREQEQVWVRHILVVDEATARSIRIQVMTNPDFTKIAEDNSQDTATQVTGGDLGWLSSDTLASKYSVEFSNAAFSMKVGETSQPIQTLYGWHIFQVLGHEVRSLSESDYQNAVSTAFNTWLQGQSDAATLVESIDWLNYVPTTPTIASVESEMGTQQAKTQAALPSETPAPALPTETPAP